jgi:hypothetical protein
MRFIVVEALWYPIRHRQCTNIAASQQHDSAQAARVGLDVYRAYFLVGDSRRTLLPGLRNPLRPTAYRFRSSSRINDSIF